VTVKGSDVGEMAAGWGVAAFQGKAQAVAKRMKVEMARRRRFMR